MKENYASLYAYITSPPKVKTQTNPDGTEHLTAALLHALTSRIPRKDPEGETEVYKWDRPLVCSFHPEFIQKYIIPNGENSPQDQVIEQGDLSIIEGKIRAKDQMKKFTCPFCGETQYYGSSTVYIEPEYLFICERGLSEEQAIQKLVQANESSNIIHVSGIVAEYPELTERNGRESMNLEICLHHDETNPKNPWVKVFGKRAREYSEMIHQESEIYINGSLQTRLLNQYLECPECLKQFSVQTAETVLVPYRIEPIKNCVIPEGHDSD